MRCCTSPSSISKICCKCSARSVLKTTILSMRFMNSGENFRRAASTAVRLIFSSSLRSICAGTWAKPMVPLINSFISLAPRFEVITIRHCERSTRRLSPRVSVALSRMPSSNCQSASEAFSISSNNRIESFNFSVCHWFSASWVSSGWVSRCPRYPGGEPINLAISCEC